jgi:phytoene/squalene synthetase
MNNSIDNYLKIFHGLDFDKIKDHPNILIAANFWEEERYQAARVCYKFMRMIDDLIDDYKGSHSFIPDNEKDHFYNEVQLWINSFKNNSKTDSPDRELSETLNRFHIPLWTMEAFAKSMIYDIYHNGFSTFNEFLNYTEGASVAPASIFVHLCSLQKKDGLLYPPFFEIKKASSPCAVFSYLVHIIRDFQKDQNNNLNYFADDLIAKNGLTREDLKSISEGSPISQGFRSLMKEYYLMADIQRQRTYDMIREISPYLEPRYRLSLDIIFNLYLMVFERIDIENGRFITEELNPPGIEIRQRVYQAITDFADRSGD